MSSREARAQGGGGGRGMSGRGGDADAKRPEDPAVRRANTRRILALFRPYRASLALLLEIGIDTVAARVLELTDYLCERAASAGIEVFSSRRTADRSGIVSVTVPGADPRELVRRCREAGIAVAQRAGRLRVSPHCYNTPA